MTWHIYVARSRELRASGCRALIPPAPRPCAGRDERFNLLAPKANSHREDGEGGQITAIHS
jgi:hypothetical protein